MTRIYPKEISPPEFAVMHKAACKEVVKASIFKLIQAGPEGLR
jgi:hypothetical protein